MLAALPALERVLTEQRDRTGLRKLVTDLGDTAPEDINDGTNTAPSKRLQAFIPSYNPGDRRKGEGKSVYGPLVTEAIGLEALRATCPRFHDWVTKLEALAKPPT